MIGKLDVDEDVMDDSLIAKRKAAAVMKTVSSKLSDTIAALGWDCYDDVDVEIGEGEFKPAHPLVESIEVAGQTIPIQQLPPK